MKSIIWLFYQHFEKKQLLILIFVSYKIVYVFRYSLDMFILNDNHKTDIDGEELSSMFPIKNTNLEEYVRNYVNKEIIEYNGDDFDYFFCGIKPEDNFKKIMSIGQKIEHEYNHGTVLGACNTLVIHGVLENGNEAKLVMKNVSMETMVRYFAQL